VVLVVAERLGIVDERFLRAIRDGCLKIAAKKGYEISRLAVMPDHLHLALRGDYRQSPDEIVAAFQNNLAYLVGQKPVWQDSYYVGTFGEYNMNAVRRQVADDKSPSPTRQGAC
jgi:REP element-mobilizing transposase RayT